MIKKTQKELLKEIKEDKKETPGLAESVVKDWDKKPHERWDLQTVDKMTAITRSRYKSWSFTMPNVSQERWDSIFGKKE